MAPERKKRVCIAITQSNYGGAQKYVYDLARSLPKDQYDVTVVFGEGGILDGMLAAEGIRTISIDSLVRRVSILEELRTFWTFYRLLRRERFDILHSNSSKMGGIGAVTGRLARVPRVVFTCHGWAFNEARPWYQRALIYAFSWLIVVFSHTTIFVSETARRQMRGIPWARRKTVVIHNGIAPADQLARAEARRTIIERAPGLVDAADALWIGIVAELHPVKNHDVLLRALPEIVRACPTARLVALGEGRERARLEALVRELHLETIAFFPGHITPAVRYMPAFDVFCLPSRSESFGQVILEAGLAQLPVVASRTGGIPELITDDTMGALVPPGDSTALAHSLLRFLRDPELRIRTGRALGKRVQAAFTLQAMTTATMRVYAAR
jgi:glycosyltransferase involved in cell wall biosynthesis